jgi:hypothetical protein
MMVSTVASVRRFVMRESRVERAAMTQGDRPSSAHDFNLLYRRRPFGGRSAETPV